MELINLNNHRIMTIGLGEHNK